MKKIFIIVCFFTMLLNVNASIVVMDSDSGRILYSQNKDEKKLIASTTKILTTIVALENGNLEDKFIVGEEIKKVNGSMLYIKEGETISLKDLLYGLNLRSGNDAAIVIATNVLGYNNFISEMNRKAISLGMYNSTFENPHGLNDDTKNYSTANDLAILMKYAIKNKEYLQISSTKKYKTKTDKDEYIWYNKNDLLSSYEYTTAGKIGYTKASGQVFVSSASKDNKNLIIVSIDEDNKFALHKSLYEKYFNIYDKYKVLDEYTFSINDNRYKNYYMYIKKDINLLLTKYESENLKIKAKINKELKDENAGYLEFKVKDKIIYKEKLYYLEYKSRKNKIKKMLFGK